MGKIISDIQFKFIIKAKDKAVIDFKVLTIQDRQIISVKAYNKMADVIYQKLEINNGIIICGYLKEDKVIIDTCYKISV